MGNADFTCVALTGRVANISRIGVNSNKVTIVARLRSAWVITQVVNNAAKTCALNITKSPVEVPCTA